MTEQIPQAELDAIRDREEAATEGPWICWTTYKECSWLDSNSFRVCKECGQDEPIKDLAAEFERGEDGVFCAHARTDQPRLRVALEAFMAQSVKDKARIAKLEEGLRELSCNLIGVVDARHFELINEARARIDALLASQDAEPEDKPR